MTVIETERLLLRTWTQNDAEAYFLINQDPQVLEFLPGPLTKEQVCEFILSANRSQDKLGYTLFAAELEESAQFIGFIGLWYMDRNFKTHFTPAVDVGWRLGSQYWGKGYATEGARASLDYGFSCIGLHEIVAMTVPANIRSIRVMEKIGMQRDFEGDFAHPNLGPNHSLSQHVLYRIQDKNPKRLINKEVSR